MTIKQLQEANRGRGRGRPKLNFALRVRNWTWYWLVKNELQLADDGLDARFVDKNAEVRTRLFFRIRNVGSSPDSIRSYRSLKSLFEIVHEAEPERLTKAKETFESSLWDLLSKPERSVSEYGELIRPIVEKRGWFRAPYYGLEAGGMILGDDEPAFEKDIGEAHLAMLRHLVFIQPDIEALTLLAALFREAHAAFDLELSIKLRQALAAATRRFIEKNALPDVIAGTLEAIIIDRIFYNRIFEEGSYESEVNPYPEYPRGNRTRVSQIKNFVDNYRAIGVVARSFPIRFPIVARTERLDWLISNKEAVAQGGLLWAESVLEDSKAGLPSPGEQALLNWQSQHKIPPRVESGLLETPDTFEIDDAPGSEPYV